MRICNTTNYTLDDIQSRPLLKCVQSNWRQRNIRLYEHPTPGHVFSVGITFDESLCVVCEELYSDWHRELKNPNFKVVTQ